MNDSPTTLTQHELAVLRCLVRDELVRYTGTPWAAECQAVLGKLDALAAAVTEAAVDESVRRARAAR